LPLRHPRLGLCCQFLDAPIHFRTTTHRYVSTLPAAARWAFLARIATDNAAAVLAAVEQCATLGIGAFRVNSQILPLATHPTAGYRLEDLPGADAIVAVFRAAGDRARALDIRLSFHPDQYCVLNSHRPEVVAAAVRDLTLHADLATMLGADVVNIHGGSTQGGKVAALERLVDALLDLPAAVRRLVTLENDDRAYTVEDLLPVCLATGVPLLYDVHHHRCHPDRFSETEAWAWAVASWGDREPYAHLSTPRDGWAARDPRPHADQIDVHDFPAMWRGARITVDLEARDKERAVIALLRAAPGVTSAGTERDRAGSSR